jgi:hypothetical protein
VEVVVGMEVEIEDLGFVEEVDLHVDRMGLEHEG